MTLPGSRDPQSVPSLDARHEPLGATLRDGGANFAVAAPQATAVTVCLFGVDGAEVRIPMTSRHGRTWAVFVPGVTAGTPYGFRVDGPWDPDHGLVFNPAKLLIDPYARATVGTVIDADALRPFRLDDATRRDDRDSAASTLLGLVMPQTPMFSSNGRRVTPGDLVIYEAHVRGLTERHPDVPESQRGTYQGAAHPAVLRHLTSLGVNAIEFLPVQQGVSEPFLAPLGLTNYWNYSPIAWFAPHAQYSAAVRAGQHGGQIAEFRDMVQRYHDAGIAVILDVVYNHTAEGRIDGPMLSYRGLANREYYRVDPRDPRSYLDTTGCGNSVRCEDPITLRLILDSLRYWVCQMGVDGFRFDLATSLGREDGRFDPSSGFLDAIHADPILRDVLLIAEPWDVSDSDGYQVGGFPVGWHDWNDRYRDVVRDFWRGVPGKQRDLASVVSGSAEIFGWRHQGPTASINFVTAHDGFTLADLVMYDHKHNEANGQLNLDGAHDNRSWNCGVEGPTDDDTITSLRQQQMRSMLGTLLLSWGVPMMSMGDELGRTQSGNNNAYCQDNAISWIDWQSADAGMQAFTTDAIRLRREHPLLQSAHYPGPAELTWLRPDGAQMSEDDWHDPSARSIIWLVTPQNGARLLVIANAWDQALGCSAPLRSAWSDWRVRLSSAEAPPGAAETRAFPPHSLTVLIREA